MITKVTFKVERADVGVGIMAEGFSAWDEEGDAWCDLREMVTTPIRVLHRRIGPARVTHQFDWFNIATGDPAPPPANARLVEALLTAYVEAYYAGEESARNG